jgi:hypothetical protein
MKSQNCKQIQAVLLDYIEKEMSSDERERVSEHLAECHYCNKEYKGLRAMLDKTKNLSFEDPGEEFWRQLPQKVLEEVKLHKELYKKKSPASNVVELAAHKPPSNSDVDDDSPHHRVMHTGVKTATINNHSDFKGRRLTAVAAIAAILLLTINVVMLSPKPAGLWFDQVRFQASINTDKGLSQLAQILTLPAAADAEVAPYGFAEQHRTDKAYVVGLKLAESFAYLQGHHYQNALQQLNDLQRQVKQLPQWPTQQSVRQESKRLRVSAVTLSSIRKAIELLQAPGIATNGVAQEQVTALLKQFQRDFENYVVKMEPNQLVLYRAGIWVFNASLVLAAQDPAAFNRLGLAAKLDYLQNAFVSLKAPVGVQHSLQEIATRMEHYSTGNAPLSRKDFRAMQQALQNLNALLG